VHRPDRSPWTVLVRAARRPGTQTDALQVVKAVVAGTLAWVLTADALGLASPYLAPWTALLAVHATVYRSVRRGAQSVAATFLGVVLAFGASSALGDGVLTLALALLVGLVAARLPGLRTEGIAVATTALFVLTGGMADDVVLLGERLAATGIGVAVALVVNVALVPPVSDRSATQALDRVNAHLGHLLVEMADDLCGPELGSELSEGWMARTREIDDELADARGWVRQTAESHWWNPRRRLEPSRLSDPESMDEVLRRLEVGVASVRGMARAIHESTASSEQWDADFRDAWIDLLGRTGHRVADPIAEVGELASDLRDLTRAIGRDGLEGLLWPLYGRLISDLDDIVEIVDDVASSAAVRRGRQPSG